MASNLSYKSTLAVEALQLTSRNVIYSF